MLQLVMAGDYVELQRREHSSHVEDGSKRLKYDQMVATREAVMTAPQLSAPILCRNMLLHDSPTKTILPEHMHCFQYQVYHTSRKLCAKQLKGFEIDD
jgi:hypothetical protein